MYTVFINTVIYDTENVLLSLELALVIQEDIHVVIYLFKVIPKCVYSVVSGIISLPKRQVLF